MSTPSKRGRLEVEEIRGAMVVSLSDSYVRDEQHLQMLGEQLFTLVDDLGKKYLILDFTSVRHIGSATLERLFALHRKISNAGGKLVLCQVDPGVYEVFEITRTNRRFLIVDTVEQALAVIQSGIRISCPVAGCDGCTPSLLIPRHGVVDTVACTQCAARFQPRLSPASGSEEWTALVAVLSLPTYERESVRLSLSQVPLLEVVGRLDLFSSDALEKAWRTAPAPRRLVIDVTKATELSQPGVEALLELCARDEEDSRSVILIDKAKPEQASAFPETAPLYQSREAAVAALGEIPPQSKAAIVVRVQAGG